MYIHIHIYIYLEGLSNLEFKLKQTNIVVRFVFRRFKKSTQKSTRLDICKYDFPQFERMLTIFTGIKASMKTHKT